ncbi:ig family protein [Stylonychia lemnae]|uniref:Ig family protein n=1 Tax=Stylonychia lemnae TaxID=5949 RepID=A0A078AY21_STYLE|nr:ig family protein [Stylonychia lemnae]|eukprot:CDW87325.1 ig family protein [Stylonychia lemnae]
MLICFAIFSLIKIRVFSRQTSDSCPDNHKYGFYLSSPNSNYNLEVWDSCMDPDDSTYATGNIIDGINAGFLMKVSYDGNIDWFIRNTDDTNTNMIPFYKTLCTRSFVYSLGYSTNSQVAHTSGQTAVYVAKFHSTQKLVYVKNIYTSGVATQKDILSGADITEDIKMRAQDGQILMAKGTATQGYDQRDTQGTAFNYFQVNGFQIAPDQRSMYFDHSIKNVYSSISPSYFSSAVMKLNLNLDIEWYVYIKSNDGNDESDNVLVLGDNSVISSGCIRASALKMYSTTTTECDITMIKISAAGALQWAVSTGGSSQDLLFDIASSDNYEIIYSTGTVQSSNYRYSSDYDFFIASQKSSDGSKIAFKAFGGSGVDIFNGISVSKMGHISLVGRSTSTDGPVLSYSSWTSIFLMKIDSSLADNNCFYDRSVPVYTDIKARIELVSDPLCFTIAGQTLYTHSNIASDDKTSAYTTQGWLMLNPNKHTEYPRQMGQSRLWTEAKLFNGDSLPATVTFDTTNQKLTGYFTNAGIYFIKMLKTLSTTPVYSAQTQFYIYVEDDYPMAYGIIPTQSIYVNKFFTLTLTPNILFTYQVSEVITLEALNFDYSSLPSWLRFFPSNNTLLGYPTYEQIVNISVVCYDPQRSNATIYFTIKVQNSRPYVISQPKDICVYKDKLNQQFRYELPQIFQDPDGQQLDISMSEIANQGSCPAYIKFTSNGMVFYQDKSIAPSIGQCTVQLLASDGFYSARTQLKVTSLEFSPKIDTTNSSCTNILYKYLDNEPAGVYYLGFSKCFQQVATYSASNFDGSIMNNEIFKFNSTIGELMINAQFQYSGSYYLKLTGYDICMTSVSLYANIILNGSPQSKSLKLPDQTSYVFESFTFQLDDNWFFDFDTNQNLQIAISYSQVTEYNWIQFTNGRKKTITGKPQFTQNYTVRFTATDNYGASAYSDLKIIVIENTKPQLTDSSTLRYSFNEGQVFSIDLPQSFKDLDSLDAMSYGILQNTQDKSTWAMFSPLSQTLSGIAPTINTSLGNSSTFTFGFMAQDSQITINRRNVQILVNRNFIPKINKTAQNLTFLFNRFQVYQMPLDLFSDNESQTSLRYALKQMIGRVQYDNIQLKGLSWFSNNRSLVAFDLTNYTQIGRHQFQLIAIDDLNQIAYQTFFIEIKVENPNSVGGNISGTLTLIVLLMIALIVVSFFMQFRNIKNIKEDRIFQRSQLYADNIVEKSQSDLKID